MHQSRLLALAISLLVAGSAVLGGCEVRAQAVQGSSHSLPDGVQSVSPDSLLEDSQDPDSNLAESGDPDAQLEGAGTPIEAHSVDPDTLVTTSQDASELPSAASEDAVPMPASIPAAPALPQGCATPSGDQGWSNCLGALQAQLSGAQARLDSANGAYSRSITNQTGMGAERASIIAARNAARTDVDTLTSTLSRQVARAEQAGVSSWVVEPYAPKSEGW